MKASAMRCVIWKKVGTNVKASGESNWCTHEGHPKAPRDAMAVRQRAASATRCHAVKTCREPGPREAVDSQSPLGKFEFEMHQGKTKH